MGILPKGVYTYKAYHTDDKYYTPMGPIEGTFESNNESAYEINIAVPSNVYVDENATVNVTVPQGVTGNVTVTVNGINHSATKITDGFYQVNVTLPAAGNYTVNATVSNDSSYPKKTSDNKILEALKVNCTVNISVSGVIRVGENATVNVTVPNDVTGNVTVNVNGVEYSAVMVNDTAYVVSVALPEGNYTMNTVISNDSKYNDKTSENKPFEVKRQDLDIDIDIEVIPDVPGENTDVTVTVPENVTGTVTVVINGTAYPTVKVSDGVYKVDTILVPGYYTLDVIVSNDPKYRDKISENQTFEVPESGVDLDIAITVNLNSVSYGDVVECIVTVVNKGPGDASGVFVNVVKSDDLEYVSDNLTDVSYAALKDLLMASLEMQSYDKSTGIWYIGDLAKDETVKLAILLKANYVGTRNVDVTVKSNDTDVYGSNNNASANITAAKVVDYSISLDVESDKNTTLTVTVPVDVTGDVIITLNGKDYPVTAENGAARLVISLPAGKYTASARLINDSKYADGKTADSDFEIVKNSDYDITTKVTPGKNSGKTVITVEVPEDATGDVIISLDGKEYRVTPQNGIATLELNLAPGEYVASARLVDDPVYAEKESNKVPFTISKNSSEKNSTDSNATVKHDSLKDKTSTLKDYSKAGNLKDYPTGNPILVLLLVLVSMGALPLRRIKK